MSNLDSFQQVIVTPLPGEPELPEVRITAKAIVEMYHSDFVNERQRGVTWEMLANRLRAKGVEVTPKTLSRYVSQLNSKKRSKRGRHRQQSQLDDALSSAPATVERTDGDVSESPVPVNSPSSASASVEPAHNPTFHELINGPSSTSTVTIDAQAVDG